MRKLAIYGKGGIGKSTTTSNLSAALSMLGLKVMQIGCDPKADSTKNLMGGNFIPTVLEVMNKKGDNITLEDIVFEGFNGVLCVEAGGPTPGVGCAGRGIIAAFEKLATEINSSIYHYIPRDKVVQLSENDGKTVIEKESSCEMANVYLELAKKIIA